MFPYTTARKGMKMMSGTLDLVKDGLDAMREKLYEVEAVPSPQLDAPSLTVPHSFQETSLAKLRDHRFDSVAPSDTLPAGMSGMHIAQHISPMVDVVSQLESRVEDLEDQVRAQKILAQHNETSSECLTPLRDSSSPASPSTSASSTDLQKVNAETVEQITKDFVKDAMTDCAKKAVEVFAATTPKPDEADKIKIARLEQDLEASRVTGKAHAGQLSKDLNAALHANQIFQSEQDGFKTERDKMQVLLDNKIEVPKQYDENWLDLGGYVAQAHKRFEAAYNSMARRANEVQDFSERLWNAFTLTTEFKDGNINRRLIEDAVKLLKYDTRTRTMKVKSKRFHFSENLRMFFDIDFSSEKVTIQGRKHEFYMGTMLLNVTEIEAEPGLAALVEKFFEDKAEREANAALASNHSASNGPTDDSGSDDDATDTHYNFTNDNEEEKPQQETTDEVPEFPEGIENASAADGDFELCEGDEVDSGLMTDHVSSETDGQLTEQEEEDGFEDDFEDDDDVEYNINGNTIRLAQVDNGSQFLPKPEEPETVGHDGKPVKPEPTSTEEAVEDKSEACTDGEDSLGGNGRKFGDGSDRNTGSQVAMMDRHTPHIEKERKFHSSPAEDATSKHQTDGAKSPETTTEPSSVENTAHNPPNPSTLSPADSGFYFRMPLPSPSPQSSATAPSSPPILEVEPNSALPQKPVSTTPKTPHTACPPATETTKSPFVIDGTPDPPPSTAAAATTAPTSKKQQKKQQKNKRNHQAAQAKPKTETQTAKKNRKRKEARERAQARKEEVAKLAVGESRRGVYGDGGDDGVRDMGVGVGVGNLGD